MRTRVGNPFRRPTAIVLAVCFSIVSGCGRGEKRAESSAVTPEAPAPAGHRPFGTLRKVINEGNAATTGVARGVHLVRDGKDVEGELGMPLLERDVLTTDGQTRAVIESKTGSEIFIGEGDEVTLSQDSVLLGRGRLFSRLRSRFRLETKYVVAGVEGTEVDLTVDSDDVVWLTVLQGVVKVSSRTGRWIARQYGEGEHGVVRGEAEPEKNRLDPTELQNIRQWVQEFEGPGEQRGAGIAR
jgi:ferric-dicitrate binding protein FerR (iron transport regulator)